MTPCRFVFISLLMMAILVVAVSAVGSFSVPTGSGSGLNNPAVSAGQVGSVSTPQINSVQTSDAGPCQFPRISSIAPDSGAQGRTVPFVLKGRCLKAGATVNLTKAGNTDIPATGIAVVTSEVVTGTFILQNTTQEGYWLVRLSQNGVNASGNVKFRVTNSSIPKLYRINPEKGQISTTVPFVLTGENFEAGMLVRLDNQNGANISADSVTVSSYERLNGSFSIPGDATLGNWKVFVVKNGIESRNSLQFRVISNVTPAYLARISPSKGYVNSTVPFTLKGQNFVSGAIVNLTRWNETNITATGITVITTSQLTGNFTIPADAKTGNWRVKVQQGVTMSKGEVLFKILPLPVPVVSRISPRQGSLGSVVIFSLYGKNFVQGADVLLMKNGSENLPATHVTYLSESKLNGMLSIPLNTTTGDWRVFVRQSGIMSKGVVPFTILSS